MPPSIACRSLVRIAVLLLALSTAGSVHAQDQGQGIIQMQENEMGADERAKAHFRVGTSLYDAGRFNEAAEEWEKAFALSQRSELLYNVYVAYRDAASSTDKAIDALRRYLELGRLDATRRLQLEARLNAMEEAQAQSAQAQPTDATTSEDVTDVTDVTNVTDQDVAPVATEAPTTSESKVLPVVLMASGGALLLASVVTGLMANGVESDLEDQCESDLCPADVDLEGERSKGNTLIALNAITGLAGVLSLGTGVVLFLMAGDEEVAPSTSAFNLGCSTTGCSGAFRTSF